MFTQIQVKSYLDKKTAVTGYARRNYVDPYFMFKNPSINGGRYNISEYFINRNNKTTQPTQMELLKNPITQTLKAGWKYDIYIKRLDNNKGNLNCYFADATNTYNVNLSSTVEQKITITMTGTVLGFLANADINYSKVQIFITNEGALSPLILGFCNDFEGQKTEINNISCDEVELFGINSVLRDTLMKARFRDTLTLKYQRLVYNSDKLVSYTIANDLTTLTFSKIQSFDKTSKLEEMDCLQFNQIPVANFDGILVEGYTVLTDGTFKIKIKNDRFNLKSTDPDTIKKAKIKNYLDSFPVILLARVDILEYLPSKTSAIIVTGENRILSNKYDSYTITDSSITFLKPNVGTLTVDLANINFIEEVHV